MHTGNNNLRWDPYFLKHGAEAIEFSKDYFKGDRKLLFILGNGFDIRMCNGVKKISGVSSCKKLDCMVLDIKEGANSPSRKYISEVEKNRNELQSIVKLKGGSVNEKAIEMWSTDKRRIGSTKASTVFLNISEFSEYTDIIVDVSALPRAIYFSIIGNILSILDHTKTDTKATINLHILASENVSIDSSISSEGLDERASYMHGYRSKIESESEQHLPKIWIPILGSDQLEKLSLIYDLVKPDEICPMLPFPSTQSRRGIDLIIEYHKLLFDNWRIEKSNILYSNEQNPFETYRRICRTLRRYDNSLKSLGGCRGIISANSSKLLSIGGFLAAYEMRSAMTIGVAHVESLGYQYIKSKQILDEDPELFLLWIFGEPYHD